ncbi:MAG: hypothetical protein QHI38_10590, partial [Armatimonadota bacterium]|nr:hypothetical protein [Armatimonadota bacterium]
FAVVISYYLLFSVVERLRITAGVASDTGTPIDVLAWLGCIFAACAISGNLMCGVLRSAGVASLLGMLLILAVCLVLHLHDCGSGSLVMDGFAAAFGGSTLPVLTWTVSSGLVAGWALSTDRRDNWSGWPSLGVFVGMLVSLAIVFYPVERYFMNVFGGK